MKMILFVFISVFSIYSFALTVIEVGGHIVTESDVPIGEATVEIFLDQHFVDDIVTNEQGFFHGTYSQLLGSSARVEVCASHPGFLKSCYTETAWPTAYFKLRLAPETDK